MHKKYAKYKIKLVFLSNICYNEENIAKVRKIMKRKKIWLKLGVLVSIISISISTVPYQKQVQAKTEYVYAQKKETQKVSAKEYNTIALDFVTSLKPEDFQTWDQSLGEMTEKEAAEIKTFLETTVIKDEKDDYRKAKKIYEWITKNIRYARPQDQNVGLRPYDVFKYKVAVCGGYSNLYKAMLNLAGIPAILVTGDTTSGAHAWNMLYTDGKWFFSDSTWGTSDPKNFDYGLEEFSKSHTSVDLQGVSAVDENGIILGFHKGLAVLGITGGEKTITVPEKFNGMDVTSVSESVFSSKYGMEHLVVTEKVNNIEDVNQSTTLKSITVAKENQNYTSKDGVLFTKDLSKILIYPYQKEDISFVIPKEVQHYDEKETFQNPYVKELLVEEGNTKFSSYDGAVYNTDQTILFTVPEGKEKIYVAGTVKLDNIALNGKKNLKEIVLEDGITNIPSYALNGCGSLTKIYIPKSVEEIMQDSFTGVNMGGLTILGEKGSAAEKFAKEHQIRFIDVREIEIKIEETKELIQKAKEYDDSSVYTEESIKVLRDAIDEAEQIVGQSDVTVEQLNKAIENLNSAIINMEKIKEEPEEPEVPVVPEAVIAKKKEAKELVVKAKTYDNLTIYTEESVKELRSAIRSVEDLLEKDNVTVEELEEAMDNLNSVIDGMKKLEEPKKPEDTEEPKKPENPSKEETSEQASSEVPKTSDVSTPATAGLGAMLSMAVIAFLQRRKK